MTSDPCEPLAIDVWSECYRVAAALTTAYALGQREQFEQLLDEASSYRDTLTAMCEGTHVLLTLLAEAEGRSLEQALESYCTAAIGAAEGLP
jgi:hypothetical protein